MSHPAPKMTQISWKLAIHYAQVSELDHVCNEIYKSISHKTFQCSILLFFIIVNIRKQSPLA